MHHLNPLYWAAFSLKWGIMECVRLNGETVRHRKHYPLRTMMYLANAHANMPTEHSPKRKPT